MDVQTEVATHTINILRVAEGQRQAAVDRLVELQSDLTSQLEKSEGLSQNRLAKLTALLKQTDQSIAAGYSDISGSHADGLKKIAAIEAKQAIKVVNGQIGLPVVSAMIPEKQLETIVDGNHIFGHSSKDWWEGQATDLQTKFRGIVQQGVLLGHGVDEMARKVRGTKDAGYEDGIMAAKKREAAALVRSAAISVSNEARLRQFKELGDVVKGIQWVSTLDTRTTSICRGLDGKMWRLPDYEPVGHDKAFPGPTAHWNCRSTQVSVLRSWDELSGKDLPSIGDEELEARMTQLMEKAGAPQAKIDNVLANARASMDGQTKDTVDFEKWLRLQSDSRIDSILGPGRAAIWKTGKVTVSDMTDQTNRPLTIEQLESVVETGTAAPETLGQQFLPMVSTSVPLTAKTTAELNKKASAEIEDIVQAAEAEEPATTKPDDSPATMQAILANPAGQTLKAKWIKKIQDANPDMEPKDVLANATQAAIVEQAAKAKAAVLSKAKKKMVAGKELTPSELDTINGLSAEEANTFSQGVQDAQFVIAQKAVILAAEDAIAKLKVEQKANLLQAITDATAKGDSATAKLDPNDPIAQAITPEEFQAAYLAGKTIFENTTTKANILKDITAQAAQGKPLDPDDADQIIKLGGTQADVDDAHAFGVWMSSSTKAALLADAKANILAGMNAAPMTADELAAVQGLGPEESLQFFQDIADVKNGKAVAAASALTPPGPLTPAAPPPEPTVVTTKPTTKEISESPVSVEMKNTLGEKGMSHFLYNSDGLPVAAFKGKATKISLGGEIYADNASQAFAIAKKLIENAEAKGSTNVVLNLPKGIQLNGNSQIVAGATSFNKNDFSVILDQLNLATQWNPLTTSGAPTKSPVVVTPATIPNPTPKAPDPADLTFVKTLPGSTSPSLMVDSAGKRWVMKEAKSVSQAHLASEMLADDIYRAAGVDVPMGGIVKGAKITEFLENGQPLGSLTGAAKTAAEEAMAKNFVLDALMGNWDVVGASGDNVLVVQGKPVRIDNGGALLWRAMGKPKDGKSTTAEILELKTLRNKADNPRTAAVYGRLTKAEIDKQIDDLINKRDAILAVAFSDPASYDFLKNRFDWLEKQRPAKPSLMTMQVARTAAAAIPANIAQILSRKTNQTWSYDGDGDQIEDTRIQFWRELDLQRKPLLISQAKLTEKGSFEFRERLVTAGFPRGGSGPAILRTQQPGAPVDEYLQAQIIVAAAKTLNHHVTAGTPTKVNPEKIKALTDTHLQLMKQIPKTDSPAKKAHLMTLQEQAQKVMTDKMLGINTAHPAKPTPTPATVKAWEKWIAPKATAGGKPLPKDVLDYETMAIFENLLDSQVVAPAAPAAPAAPPGNPSLQGWRITQGQDWEPPQKKILPTGQLMEVSRSPSVAPRKVDEYFKLFKDDVTVEFHPRGGAFNKHQFTRNGLVNEGNVTVRIPGDAGPDTVQRALETYGDLGIPASPTTDTFKELLYIHRTVYQRRDHDKAEYTSIWNDSSLDEGSKLDQLKTWAESEYKVKLPRGGRKAWTESYNPEGRAMGTDGVSGAREYKRWDVTEKAMLKELKDHLFTHRTNDPIDLLKSVIQNDGVYTPTADRVRLGIPLSTGGSPAADINTGGAVYLYTNLSSASGIASRAGPVWGPELAMRQDLYSVNSDAYGSKQRMEDRKSLPEDLKTMNTLGMRDTGLFKNGVSFFRNLRHFQVNSVSEMDEAIKLFKDAGILSIDGKPIESIVRITKF